MKKWEVLLGSMEKKLTDLDFFSVSHVEKSNKWLDFLGEELAQTSPNHKCDTHLYF